MGCSLSSRPKSEQDDQDVRSDRSISNMYSTSDGKLNSEVFKETPAGGDMYEWFVIAVMHFRDVTLGFYDPRFCNGQYTIPKLCEDEEKAGDDKNCSTQGMTVGDLSIRSFGLVHPKTYVLKLKHWISQKLCELPEDPANPEFQKMARHITRRIYRVWAHAYVKHYALIKNCPNKHNVKDQFKLFMMFAFNYQLLHSNDPEVEQLSKSRVDRIQKKLHEMKKTELLDYFKRKLSQDKDEKLRVFRESRSSYREGLKAQGQGQPRETLGKGKPEDVTIIPGKVVPTPGGESEGEAEAMEPVVSEKPKKKKKKKKEVDAEMSG